MRLRHGAALALLGWYLMVPPLVRGVERLEAAGTEKGRIDINAPLSAWENRGGFEEAADCNAELAADISAAKRNYQRPKTHEGMAAERSKSVDLQFMLGKCVASDDPRLKGQ